jgi:hypothetical protein
LMVRVEEPADEQIGFEGSAMVRSPAQALEFRVFVHGGHVGAEAGGGKRRGSDFVAGPASIS